MATQQCFKNCIDFLSHPQKTEKFPLFNNPLITKKNFFDLQIGGKLLDGKKFHRAWWKFPRRHPEIFGTFLCTVGGSEFSSFSIFLSWSFFGYLFELWSYWLSKIGGLTPGAYLGRGFGGHPPPPFGKFFQFARVFKEKYSKTPPKFSRPYKKNQNPSFLDTPLPNLPGYPYYKIFWHLFHQEMIQNYNTKCGCCKWLFSTKCFSPYLQK